MVIGILVGLVILALLAGCFFVFLNSVNGAVGAASVVCIIILFIAFILVPFSFHTVNTGEIAVVKHLGKIKETREPGTSFALWITNRYVTYDTKVQNLETSTMAYSADAQTMDVTMTIQYSIATDKVVDIATQYGSLKALESRITSVAIEQAKSVLSAHKAMDIIAKRASISPEVEDAIMNAVGEEYFVDISTVALTNIDFSDAFELAVENKMIAEQDKLKADYENETKIAKAKAEAEAKLKAAEAEIEIAKAEAEAKKIKAEGEAEANRIISESLTDVIIKKSTIDNWNGELPVVVGNGEYILPTEILG